MEAHFRTDDPDNENTDYPTNDDPDTKTVYYDETKFVEGMADPFIFWDEQTGYYYMTGSYFPEDGDEIDASDNCQQYDRVVLRRGKTLEELQDRSKQVTIWKSATRDMRISMEPSNPAVIVISGLRKSIV